MGKSRTSKTKRRMPSSRSLPEEIIHDILSWLPVKSIARFRCVSKYWCNDLFKSQNFIKLHLEHAVQMNKFNLLVSNFGADQSDPTETFLCSIDDTMLLSSRRFLGHAKVINFRKAITAVLGSCNGLVCIHSYDRDDIFIWNPCTKEYKKVPETSTDIPPGVVKKYDFKKSYGFAYDSGVDDYKLIRILGFEECPESEVRVYTLGSNTWRNLGFIPYGFSSYSKKAEGHLLNGVLYWIASVCHTGNESSGVLVSFDICKETFHGMPLPNNCSDEEIFLSDLGTWDGKLCITRRNHKQDPKICKHHHDHVDVWTMSDNTWSKLPNITAQLTRLRYVRPIQTLQNGEILFEGGPGKGNGFGLITYDPKLERARVLRIQGFPDGYGVETYVETFVSVNSGTFVGQQQGEEETDELMFSQ